MLFHRLQSSSMPLKACRCKMKATVTLFWSPACRFCGPAKAMIEEIASERDDFKLVKLTGADPGAQEFALKHNIQSTPTFIIEGPGHPEVIGLKGGRDKKTLNKYIDVALGKQKVEEKKGFFDSIFAKFGL